MLSRKNSNAVSIVVSLWGISIIGLLLLKYAEGVIVSDAFFLGLLEMLAVALLPLLVIYANKRNQSPQVSGFDLILQIAFYALWAALGMVFLFGTGGAHLFVLMAALAVLLVILVKAALSPKIQKKAKTEGGVNVGVVIIALSVLTSWVPFGFVFTLPIFNQAAFSAHPMAGLMVIPIYATLAPMLIAGAVVSVAGIGWAIRQFVAKSRKPLALNGVLILSSAAYLAVWAFYIMPILVGFQLLSR